MGPLLFYFVSSRRHSEEKRGAGEAADVAAEAGLPGSEQVCSHWQGETLEVPGTAIPAQTGVT